MQKRLLSLCLVLCLLLCACGQSAAPAEKGDAPASASQTAPVPSPSEKAASVSPTNVPGQKGTVAAESPEKASEPLPGMQSDSLPAETKANEQAVLPDELEDMEEDTEQNSGPGLWELLLHTPQDREEDSSSPSDSGECTISILCYTAVGKSDLAPPDGEFLSSTTVSLSGGETVYDVLRAVCAENGIALVGNSGYIKSIDGLAERDCGGGSGWLYRVNGVSPSISCGNYEVFDGDDIEWLYTCEMGNDL